VFNTDPVIAGSKIGEALALSALTYIRAGNTAPRPIAALMGRTLRAEAARFNATQAEIFSDAAVERFREVFARARENIPSWYGWVQ
jgi:hypothetical protein